MNQEGRKHILLVEDEAIIALSEKTMLEDIGYTVTTAHNGEAAVATASGNTDIDLILMDIDLGSGIDGTEAAERILEQRDIPVLFLSSHTEPEIVEKTESISSYGYVVKNAGITVLDASIKMAFKLFNANRRIAEREALQQAVITNITDCILIIDADRRIRFASPNLERIFGWNPAQVSGLEFPTLADSADKELVTREFHDLLRNSAAQTTIEFGFRTADGQIRPVELTAINRCADSAIAGILINFRDITERRRADEELGKTRILLNAAFEQSPVPMILASAEENTIKIINSAAAELMGIDPSAYLDTPITMLTPSWTDISPDGTPIPKDDLPIPRALGGERIRDQELMVIRSDGTTRWRSCNSGPVYDSAGKLIAALEIFPDITSHKLAEEQLRFNEAELKRQNNLFNTLLNLLPEGVFMVEAPSGKPILANAMACELLGRGVLPDASKENLSEIYQAFKAATREPYPPQEMPIVLGMNGVTASIDDMLVVRPDGTETLLEVFGTPVHDEAGSVWASLVTFRDITERKRIEQKLNEKNEELQAAMEEMEATNEELIAAMEEMETTNEELMQTTDELIRKEQSLQREKQFIESLLESLPGYLYVYDDTGKLIRWNRKHETMTGYSGAELAGMTLDKWFDAEEFPRVAAAAAEVFKTGYGEVEAHLLLKGGGRMLVRSNGVLMNVDGKQYFTGVGIDISAQRKMEDELRRQTNLLNTIIESASDAIFAKDSNGIYRAINRVGAGMLGKSVSEVIGRTDSDLLPEQTVEQFRITDELVMKNGRGFEREELSTINGIDYWFLAHKTPWLNESGDIIGVIGISKDITERKRIEDQLKRNLSQLQSLTTILQHKAESVQEFLDFALEQALRLTGSRLGYIYHYNEQRREFVLNTWSRDVMPACSVMNPQTCYELDKTGLWGEAVRQRRPIIVNDYPKQHPHKRGYPEGHVHLNRFLTVPVFRNEEIVGVIGLANKDAEYDETDVLQISLLMEGVWKVTDRLTADERIKELLAEKDLILREVHHRIKNNMSSIHSLLALQARMSGEPTVTDALQDAGRRIQSMQSLYEQLYRSDLSGMLSAEAYLSPLVRTIAYTFPNAAAISITDSITPIILSTTILQPLGIIVTELITNSMKYAFAGRNDGSIGVTLERENKELILTVRDDGPGIPESKQTQETPGFGLKLVRLLAEQLDGTITISANGGTSVTLNFPAPGAE